MKLLKTFLRHALCVTLGIDTHVEPDGQVDNESEGQSDGTSSISWVDRFFAGLLIASHVRLILANTLLAYYHRELTNPGMWARFFGLVSALINDSALQPLAVTTAVTTAVLISASLIIRTKTRRLYLFIKSLSSGPRFNSFNEVVKQLTDRKRYGQLVSSMSLCGICFIFLIGTVALWIDVTVYSLTDWSVTGLCVYCLSVIAFVLCLYSVASLVTQWILVLALLYITLGRLVTTLTRIELSLIQSLKCLIISKPIKPERDLQIFTALSHITIISHQYHQYRSVFGLIGGSSPTSKYWSQLTAVLIASYLIASTNLLFSAIYLVTSHLMCGIIYLMLVPYLLPVICILLLLSRFNLKIQKVQSNLRFAYCEMTTRCNRIPTGLRHKMNHVIQQGEGVVFRCALIGWPISEALLLAVFIRQARNFLLLIKIHV